MTNTQADLTKALRFAIQLTEAEGYPECAADLRAVLERLTRPTDTQGDLTERARKLVEDAIKASAEFGGFRENLAIMIVAALQSEREAAAAEAQHATTLDWIQSIEDGFGVQGDTIVEVLNALTAKVEAAAAEARRAALEEAADALKHLGAVYDNRRGDAVYTDDIVLALLNPKHKFKSTDR